MPTRAYAPAPDCAGENMGSLLVWGSGVRRMPVRRCIRNLDSLTESGRPALGGVLVTIFDAGQPARANPPPNFVARSRSPRGHARRQTPKRQESANRLPIPHRLPLLSRRAA